MIALQLGGELTRAEAALAQRRPPAEQTAWELYQQAKSVLMSSGWSEGSFEQTTNVTNFVDGEDDFWVADAAISYRLPKRYGFITVGVSNMFDEEFKYFDTDSDNPSLIPSRFVFGRLTLAIP